MVATVKSNVPPSAFIRGIAVDFLDFATGMHILIPPVQNFWFVENQMVALIGDMVLPHMPPPHVPPPPMVTGSHWMHIDNNTMVGLLASSGINHFGRAMVPVCRRFDIAICNCQTTGRPWWLIN